MGFNRSVKVSRYFTIALAILPAAAGSAVTFLYVFAALAGVVDIFRKRISTKLNKYDKIIVYPALIFFVINTLSIVRVDFRIQDLTSTVPLLLFLLPYFFIKRYRHVSEKNQFLLFWHAIPFGAFLLLPWILYEGFFLGQRMSAGAGNAIPFGMICAIMMPLCLMHLFEKLWSRRLVAMFAAIIFAVGLVHSQSRGMYVAAVPNVLLALGYLIFKSKNKVKASILAVIILAFCGTFALNSTIVAKRFEQLIEPFASILNDTKIDNTSVRHRYYLAKKGFCFAQEKLLVGYGIANREAVLASKEIPEESYFDFCKQFHGVFHYSHFHNGFLTSVVDAGIFGLIATIAMFLAPICLAVFSPSDNIKQLRVAVALCLTSVYFMAGATNLLFGHDLIDAIFLIFASFIALSIHDPKS